MNDGLSELIINLQYSIDNKDPKIKCIKNPQGLVHSLNELKNIVGMRKLKNSISKQTRYLITKLEEGKKSPKMLNTILYGPPGVGKTTVGVIMAKIWHNLGYLKGSENTNTNDDNIQNITKIIKYANEPELFKIFIFGLIFLGSLVWSGIKWCYNSYGFYTLIFSILIFFLLMLVLWSLFTSYSIEIEIQNEKETENVKKEKQEDIIKITSRSDFIAQYVGWTDKKTENLLRDNKGKVLFVDEAYSLCLNSRDQFGMEAITSLNKYMSEHPDETVVIFAGYENLMKQGIFEIQPGLPRRCMWHFQCDTYDGKELTQIFVRQLAKEELKIHKEEFDQVEKLITNNVGAFPSYGGDTERLVYFAELNRSSRKDRKSGYINIEDVRNGIQELIENNIKNNSGDNSVNNGGSGGLGGIDMTNPNLYSDLINQYRKMATH